MNRTMRWALVAAIAALAIPAFSQVANPVAQDSWAVTALSKMRKAGLLKDLPEGLFREGANPSRLEIAVAAHKAYAKLSSTAQGLGAPRYKLDEAIKRADDPTDPVFTKSDLENLRILLDEAKTVASGIKEFAESAMSLAKMASEFEEELESLGVDVESMKKELSALASRIAKLEQDEFPFELDVEWNLVSYMGHSRGGRYGVTVDGRPTGARNASYVPGIFGGPTEPAGLTQDVSIGHEMAFGLTGETGDLRWRGTFAVGNLLSPGYVNNNISSPEGIFGSQSSILFGQRFSDASKTNLYVQNLEVSWDGAIAGKDASIRAGRVGYQAIPYVFRRQDTTPYFENARWDDHNWYFDGGIIQFPFKNGAKLDVFGGRQGERNSKEGAYLGGAWPMRVGELSSVFGSGELTVSNHLGLNYWQAPTRNFSYRLNYLWLEGDGNANFDGRPYNRMEVFGFEGNFQLPKNLNLNFGKAESTYKHGRGTVEGDDNRAYWANLGWSHGRADGTVGWRQIESNYGAPGDWGRMGVNWNPVDIKGWFKKVNYRAGEDDRFSLETYDAVGLRGAFDQFDPDDDMYGLVFDWHHRLTGRLGMRLGYERLHSDVRGDKAQFEWFRLGFNHDLGADMFFKMEYESSNAFTDEGNYYRPWYGDRRRGGLVTFQFGRRA